MGLQARDLSPLGPRFASNGRQGAETVTPLGPDVGPGFDAPVSAGRKYPVIPRDSLPACQTGDPKPAGSCQPRSPPKEHQRSAFAPILSCCLRFTSRATQNSRRACKSFCTALQSPMPRAHCLGLVAVSSSHVTGQTQCRTAFCPLPTHGMGASGGSRRRVMPGYPMGAED